MICHTPMVILAHPSNLAPSPERPPQKSSQIAASLCPQTLYHPHITHPFLSIVGLYSPWLPGSRQFTVDSAKKKKFVDIFLLMPETRVADAMRSAKFTEEDITNLRIRRFLQRALPGRSIQGLKAYVAGPHRSRQFCSSRPLVDNAAIVANVEEAAIIHVKSTPPCRCQLHCQH